MERAMTPVYLLILLAVCINVAAQLLLKMGMARIGHFDFVMENIWPIGWKIATNWQILLGLCCYVGSVVVWMMVLSRSDVSFAYPMSSLGYILTALAACFMLGEQVTLLRLGGIMLIIGGVFLVARSA